MKLLITYQELQQLIYEKLQKNVGLEATDDNALKISLHMKFMDKGVDSSVEMVLSMYGKDLYADYKVVPFDNLKSKLLSGLINSVTPNVVNVMLNYLINKYPQYNDIVEKVPNADRLRIHLAAIPQLKNVLQHVEIESVFPKKEGLQIIAHM